MTTTVDEARLTPSVAARVLSVPVRLYQAVRAGRPSPCRYWPTCSDYALEALAAHGALRGLGLTAGRLLRCHPWASRSGVDLVPAVRRTMSSPGVAS
ncbi:MAG TPA: membrane protein insertion efficiency factor YidD [Acidimicrobiales bacterium]|nr:membrane protein insertion efficiency factor YidD [Acidimicrobiales bacterium]